MLKKLMKAIFGDEMDLKERLFRIILVVGTVAVGAAILQGLTLVNALSLMTIYTVMFIAFVSAFILTFKFHNIELSSTILGIALIFIALPYIFLKGGGVNSGAGLWMCLGIFYVFIMFSGKKLWVFLIITLLIDLSCYVVAYQFPEMVVELATPFEKTFDSVFAVIVVGITVGIIMKFQLKVFERERMITEQQQEELKSMSKSKDVFFASMSHEIRTPINSIIGLNELILRENPSQEVQGYAKNIQNASKVLLSLVNDILDLSQLEIQKMELAETEYSVKDMLHEVIDLMQVRMMEKGLSFGVEIDNNIPAKLYGDDRRIKQIVLNLLTNAVKYTESGTVTLSCTSEKIDENTTNLKLSVADTGIGIRKEELEYLFDAFRRADVERNRRVEGTGLGLPITKHLLDLMGGNISVDSIYTQGSVFMVDIPQKVIDDAPVGAFKVITTEEKNENYYSKLFEAPEARVLIVDDDDLNLIITTKLLQDTKMSIDVARNPEECLKKTKKRYYNLILMDYMMPEMNGGNLLAEIRKQENGLCRESDVVLLSANVLVDKQNDYIQMGFDGLLEKPIDAKRLEEEVLRHIPEDLVEYRRDKVTTGQEEYFVSRLSKKRKKIYITSDGICDLPKNMLEELDIRIIDMYIKTNHGRFRDSNEIDVNNLERYLSNPENAAIGLSPTVEDYEKFFAEVLMEAEEVIYLAFAGGMGRGVENAHEAAKGFAHVHVVDSGHISSGQALVVMHAAELAKQGAPLKKILDEIAKVKNKIRCSYILPDTKIFYQRGYTSKVTSEIFDKFQMHPILRTHDSKLTIIGFRTGRLEKEWRKFFRFNLRHINRINDKIIFIVHTGCSVKQQEMILEEVNRCMKFKKVIFVQASSASACNAGLNSVGFAVYHK